MRSCLVRQVTRVVKTANNLGAAQPSIVLCISGSAGLLLSLPRTGTCPPHTRATYLCHYLSSTHAYMCTYSCHIFALHTHVHVLLFMYVLSTHSCMCPLSRTCPPYSSARMQAFTFLCCHTHASMHTFIYL